MPFWTLIEMNGLLYGTTEAGGNASCDGGSGCGTVFSFDPGTGAEKVLYSFCNQTNCADGRTPNSSLVAVNGVLYGVTQGGGLAGCAYGCGTVFSIDPSTNTEKVLYRFCSRKHCKDGDEPDGLAAANGKFYGTTALGGTAWDCCGTVFMLKERR